VANLIRTVSVTILFLIAAFSLRAADSATSYETWIKPWVGRPATSPTLNGTGLKLVVSVISGEKDFSAVTNMTPVERVELAYHIKVAASEVATNGAYRSYFVSNTEAKPGAVYQFSTDEFQKLTEALAQLPEDNAQLPPAGRRVVVQVWENSQWRVRVYDGNHLPSEVKTLLNLLANPFDKLL
jgi:hypothetical protein